MATYKTYLVGRNYVTINADIEQPPIQWDEVFDVSAADALEIERGAMPADVVPEIQVALDLLDGGGGP